MAIALLPVLVWVGIALWVLRTRRRSAESGRPVESVPAAPITLDPAELDWTASDDRQLIRLLDQSAP